MGVSWSDAAMSDHDADRADAALAEAVSIAEDISARFTEQWTANPLRPDVSVDLNVGGDDQPVFVFSVNVDLKDDLDAGEYPLDELQDLASVLRTQVADSSVNDWSWLVTVGTKAGATHT